ncbi:MAG: glycosyltransferase family 2 protein [Acidimicrobiales bacterium]
MLRRAVAAVQAALGPADELIVVDSASVTPISPIAGARLIRIEQPGANRARNAGWRAARHEMLLFFDDDVTVDTGWADALVGAMEAHPAAGFVTGRVEVPPSQLPVDYPVAIKDNTHPAELTATTPGVLGHSASLAVRRAALTEVGGFDEVLGAGGRLPMSDEVDLFDRLFAAGWGGWYEPSALAWHDQWRTKRERVRLSWWYGFGAGARIAKLRRTDRAHARRQLIEVFWRRGLRDAAGDARRRYKTAVLLDLAHLAGACAGVTRAWRIPVVDGHFAPRGGRR